jgi:hypothetical protein
MTKVTKVAEGDFIFYYLDEKTGHTTIKKEKKWFGAW